MHSVREFATFIKTNKLEQLALEELRIFRSNEIPLINLFANQTEEQLLKQIKESLNKFLTALETGTAVQVANEGFENWKNDKIPGIPKTAISLTDIILIYSGQKEALSNLIPEYTHDAATIIDIVRELNFYYKEVQKSAVTMLDQIQKEQQSQLIESEERYRDLFDNANDLIHFITPEGNIIYVNNAWMNSLGYSLEELQNKSIYTYIHEKDKKTFQQYRENLIAGKPDTKGITITFISKKGTEVITEGFVSCKFKYGKPIYTRGILRDITRRNLNEKKLNFYTLELEKREENMKQILENAPDAVIVINQTGHVLLWNFKAQELFGWSASEMTGKELVNSIIPHQYREAHTAGMKRFLSTGEARVLNKTIEITALNKKGNEFNVSLTISQAWQSQLPVFIAFIRDITQQKENELELETQRIKLEISNKELEQYAWLASHDLKEPLRKILTFSDMLMLRHKSEVSEEAQIYFEKIQDAAARMNKLIDAILEYSNVSQEAIHFVETDLNDIIKDVLSDLEISIRSNNATIKIENLPVIDAIPVQMRQLFQNLLSNSLKYRKPDVIPEIKITNSNLQNNYVQITIADNGIGFENQYAEKIFEVFQRLQQNDVYEGTGIGLALCKKIVESHKGTITAQSTSTGSTFFITLPVKQIN